MSLSWLAVRKGPIYCAPACGRGCTWAEFQQATRKAKALAADLGEGWEPEVHENLGWHFMAAHHSKKLTVYGSRGNWRALACSRWVGLGKVPAEAVAMAVQKAKEELDSIRELVESVEGVAK